MDDDAAVGEVGLLAIEMLVAVPTCSFQAWTDKRAASVGFVHASARNGPNEKQLPQFASPPPRLPRREREYRRKLFFVRS